MCARLRFVNSNLFDRFRQIFLRMFTEIPGRLRELFELRWIGSSEQT